MRVAGLQKLTLLDFPGRTAATVFTPTCNFRCPFCHNADLVTDCDQVHDVLVEEVLGFLRKRQGLLDGVCITGGEPLMQPELADFCAEVRKLGYAVKLDTNGSFPDRLRALLDAGLVDYVAMDAKNAPARYAETAGVAGLDLADVRASADLLMGGDVPFEFRTTVVRELHTADDLHALARWIEGAPAWFLQSHLDAEGVLAGPGRFHAWNPDELRALLPELRAFVPRVAVRGRTDADIYREASPAFALRNACQASRTPPRRGGELSALNFRMKQAKARGGNPSGPYTGSRPHASCEGGVDVRPDSTRESTEDARRDDTGADRAHPARRVRCVSDE